MGIHHAFVSAKSQSGDATLVSKNEWNADHPNVGLVLLEQHTASSSGSLDFTSFISSDYDEYLFEITGLLPATNGTMMYMRVQTAGGFISAAKYATAGWAWVYYANAVFGNSIASLVGQMTTSNAADCYNGASYGMDGFVRLFNPSSTGPAKRILFEIGYHENSAAHMKGCSGRACYADTPAITGFQFLYSSGAIASGTIRVYGVAKS